MEAPLTLAEIRDYERRLLDALARAAAEVDDIERNVLEPSGGERNQWVDESGEDTTLDTELGVLATEDALAREIRAALERVTRGTYGTCEGCGRGIGRPRLDAVPYARRCASCAGAGARRRPPARDRGSR